VTKSLPLSASKFREAFGSATEHLRSLAGFSTDKWDGAVFYEFGAGWDLAIPLSFYSLGIDQQILVDIRSLLKAELVNATIEMLQALAQDLRLPRFPTKCLPTKRDRNWPSRLEEWYGIKYIAPCDARKTGLPSGTIRFISSTSTLEHIPAADIPSILAECNRLLSVNGVASFIIDYQDHYSYFDKTIGPYNFLKYGSHVWSAYNPPLHFQNRLRHRDYRDMIVRSGFLIESESGAKPTPDDLESLKPLRIHPSVARGCTPHDLAIRTAHFVLRKRSPRPFDPRRGGAEVGQGAET